MVVCPITLVPLPINLTIAALLPIECLRRWKKLLPLAGKHCESGDILIKDLPLPKTEAGDILVVLGTGAYNHSMASNYNRLTRPAAVLVNKGEANLILARENYDDLIRQDRLPERLKL